jgi:protein-disulfide isomerase
MPKVLVAVLALLCSVSMPTLAQKKAENSKKTAAEAKKISKEAYRYSVQIKGLKDTICFLAYHMGDKQYIADTAKVDSKGNMVFTGSETLDPGIFMIVLPNRKYFEVIVNEPSFSVETDTASLNESLTITGSKENKVFLEYIKYVSDRGVKINDLATKFKASKNDKVEAERLRNEIRILEEDIATYRAKLADEHKGTLISNILRALTDVKRPEPPKAKNGRPDSAFKFYDTRLHYFDNVDFSDARLLRTPILLSKVKYYLENLTVVDPDSINKSADFILDKTLVNKEVFRYFLWYISNTYETSKYMGMDAVFVHVAQRYYLTDKADWVDSTTRKKISDRVKILAPLLIGKVAPRLYMRDTLNRPVVLHEVAAKHKYTVLIFYDPNCGHCQKEVPEIHDKFYSTYKAKGVEVFAACAERNPNDWRKFIRKHRLSFLNVFDTDTVVDFRNVWDIYSFPVIYVLDQEKKIIGKRVPAEELGKFIDETEKIRLKLEADKKAGSVGGK